MAELIDIVFRGDVVPGRNVVEVKEAMKDRFKLDGAALEKLFSGRPIVLKKGLTQQEAETFKQLLQKIGALASSRPSEQLSVASADPTPDVASSAEKPAETATPPATASSLDEVEVLEVGSDVLNEQERKPEVVTDIDTSALTVAPDGTDMLEEQHKKPFKPADIDTSHIQLEPASDGQ